MTHINTQTPTTTPVRDLSCFLFGLSFILPTNFLYEGSPLRKCQNVLSGVSSLWTGKCQNVLSGLSSSEKSGGASSVLSGLSSSVLNVLSGPSSSVLSGLPPEEVYKSMGWWGVHPPPPLRRGLEAP